MSKKLSIVTVSFNDVDGLLSTLDSINSQSFQEFEWIIVDGGTIDPRIGAVLKNKRVDKFIHERDNGIYDAMMKGANIASGTNLIFLNSGDIFCGSDVVVNIHNNLLDDGVSYYSAEFVSRSGKVLARKKPIIPGIYVYHSIPCNQQATVYLRDHVLLYGFGVNYKICGDYYLAAMLHKNKVKINVSNYVTSRFELGGVSTNRVIELANEAERVQREVLGLPGIFIKISRFLRLINMKKTKGMANNE